MIERKPSATALARAVNLGPANPTRKRFVTDFYGKFNGEPFRAAARSVKFKHETVTKTFVSPQIKFDPNVGSKREQFWLANLTARRANQTRVNLTRLEHSETYVKFSFKFNQKALK